MAERARRVNSPRPIAAETSAWITLAVAFAVFCAIVAVGGYFGLSYYNSATITISNTRLIKYVPTGVLWQDPDRTVAQDIVQPSPRPDECPDRPEVCALIPEGKRILGRREAGYGPVASLILPDETRINLHAHPGGFDIQLQRYRVSRWTDNFQEVVLRQASGYARYDIADGQEYKNVRYTVVVNDQVRVQLQPGGSYSVYVPRDQDGNFQPRFVTDPPMQVEVAVRKGAATVQSGDAEKSLRPADRVQVFADGAISEFQQAQWQLIPDGNFARHDANAINTQGASDTWFRSDSPGVANMPLSEQNGQFLLNKTCPPDQAVCQPDEEVFYAEFRREGNMTSNYSTGIEQLLDVDVSEYTQSLRFSSWVSVLNQSVKSAGIQGSECPIIITLKYKMTTPADAPNFYRICIYTGDRTQVEDPSFNEYIPRTLFALHLLSIELRNKSGIQEARYIESIHIEARGHDYISQVTDLSLVGE